MRDDQELDEWRDRMVRALYEELPASERRALEDRLERDPELRAEMSELREARRVLAGLADDVPGGQGGELTRIGGSPATRPGGGWRWRAAAAGVGFAAAATVFIGLLVAGLRVDRTPAGVLVRFGGETIAAPTAAEMVGGLVTRRELEAVAGSLASATAARMDDLERQRDADRTVLQAELVDAMLDYGATLNELKADDWLVVAAFLGNGFSLGGERGDEQLVLKARFGDLQRYLVGDLTRQDAVALIQVTRR